MKIHVIAPFTKLSGSTNLKKSIQNFRNFLKNVFEQVFRKKIENFWMARGQRGSKFYSENLASDDLKNTWEIIELAI